MTDDEPIDEELVKALEAIENANRDAEADSTAVSRISPDFQAPLQKVAECVRLLQKLWPKPMAPQRVVGRFELERELGRGTFGIVYLARDTLLGRPVALKVPRLEIALSPELLERFQREARAAAALDHPNIVPVFEAGTAGDICYITSAFCPGPTLAAWAKAQPAPVEPLVAARLVRALADAVEHAHQRGVIHRDLKPSNVLLEGETALVPRITDFGMARLAAESSDLTHSRAVIGTPAYMSPEQARCHSTEIGPACDVYSLGVILYELLAGRPPFQAATVLETLDLVRLTDPPPLSEFRAGVPFDLETICLKCLRKNLADRYISARALAEDLQRFVDDQPIQARRLGWREYIGNWCARPARARDAAISTIAFAAVMLVFATTSNLFLLLNPVMVRDSWTLLLYGAGYSTLYVILIILGITVMRKRSARAIALCLVLQVIYPLCINLTEPIMVEALADRRQYSENRFVYVWARAFFSGLALSAGGFNAIALYSLKRRSV